MWKEGEELVLPNKETTRLGRVWINFCGSVLYLCTSFLFLLIISGICHNVNSEFLPILYFLFLGGTIYICYYCVSAIYRSYFPQNKDKIVIGKDGIFITDEKTFKWDDVEYVYCGEEEKCSSNSQTYGLVLKSQVSRLPKQQTNYISNLRKKKKTTWLHVLYKNPDDNLQYHYQILIDSFRYSSKEISHAVEYWSGRDIGNKSDLIRDLYVDKLVKNGTITVEEGIIKKDKLSLLMPMFEEYETKKLYSSIVLGLIVPLTFGLNYLLHSQDAIDRIPWTWISKWGVILYIIGPFTVYLMVLLFVQIGQKKRFVMQKGIEELTDDEFEECSMVALSKLMSKSERKTEKILTFIFICIYAIISLAWLVLVIYLFMYKFGFLS